MDGIDADRKRSDLEALKALEEDAPELDRIEALLDRFNVFETVNFIDDEVGHSNLLSFLLDPKRNGGLNDSLIKEVLRVAKENVAETLPPPMSGGLLGMLEGLDRLDLSQTLVRREHHYIDVLLTNEEHRLAVVIENKIWADEGPGQLDWYDRVIRHLCPDWDVVKIFLTPNGHAATHDEYVPLSYKAVCDGLDRILADRAGVLAPDVRVSVEHYVRMVRRRILGDTEIVRLCQDLYQRHKRAFDLIYQHRPDYQAQLRPVVEDLIRENPGLKPDDSRKDNIKFVVGGWDTPALLSAEGYTRSNRILMFEVHNNRSSLDVHLYIGPGPDAVRQRLLAMARANPDVFLMPRSTSGPYVPIYSVSLLEPGAYETLDKEGRESELRRQWGAFLDEHLPRIEDALEREAWIWETPAS